jgi:hypothetical protein
MSRGLTTAVKYREPPLPCNDLSARRADLPIEAVQISIRRLTNAVDSGLRNIQPKAIDARGALGFIRSYETTPPINAPTADTDSHLGSTLVQAKATSLTATTNPPHHDPHRTTTSAISRFVDRP